MAINSTIYYKVMLPLDATLGSITMLLSSLIIIVYVGRKGRSRSTSIIFMNLAVSDFLNGFNCIPGGINVKHTLNKQKRSDGLYMATFIIQATVLNVSLLLLLLMCSLRFFVLKYPLQFHTQVKKLHVVVTCGVIWAGGITDAVLRQNWHPYKSYEIYVTGIFLRILIIVTTLTLSAASIYFMRIECKNGNYFENNSRVVKLKQSAAYTASLLAAAYFICHLYYLVVLLTWTDKGACKRMKKGNPLGHFILCSDESLILGHVTLLLHSIVECSIVLNQRTLRFRKGLQSFSKSISTLIASISINKEVPLEDQPERAS